MSDDIRICDHCGRPMFSGYVVNDDEYYCCDDCLHENYAPGEYNKLYKSGVAYYTEWSEVVVAHYVHYANEDEIIIFLNDNGYSIEYCFECGNDIKYSDYYYETLDDALNSINHDIEKWIKLEV